MGIFLDTIKVEHSEYVRTLAVKKNTHGDPRRGDGLTDKHTHSPDMASPIGTMETDPWTGRLGEKLPNPLPGPSAHPPTLSYRRMRYLGDGH